MIVLSTERLLIKKITPADAPFLLELMNDKDWIENIGDRGIKTIEQAQVYITNRFLKSYEEKGFGFYGIVLKESSEMIGTAGLVHREGLDAVDIGYGMLPAFRGKGYAFEATKAVFDYGYNVLRLDKIVAIVNPSNKSSIKLLEKLGLRYEKMVRLPDEDKDIKLFS
ncbi:GNAT family N-acetyltransferase [Lutimonas vermicola]|uniref:GNAT family N-acetyltransferase n=1 Tax=Lutimonas vermicola TaxID=414288 RepID=A0ABU9L2F4_9FLAO